MLINELLCMLSAVLLKVAYQQNLSTVCQWQLITTHLCCVPTISCFYALEYSTNIGLMTMMLVYELLMYAQTSKDLVNCVSITMNMICSMMCSNIFLFPLFLDIM